MMKMKLFKMTATAALLGVATSASAQLTLVSAWDFEDGPGTTTSPGTLGGGQTWNQVTNPNATLTGGPSEDFSNVDQGVDFGSTGVTAPGSTSFLNFGNNTNPSGQGTGFDTGVSGDALAGTGAKTVVAWVNAVTSTQQQMIFNYTPTGNNGEDLRFVVIGTGGLRAETSGGYFENVTANADIIGDGWTMVAAVFDGNTNASSFYVGGVGFLTGNTFGARAIDTATGGNIFLGGLDATGDRPVISDIDDVAVYNGAASLAELDAIYNNGIAIPEPGTLVLFGLALGAMLVFRRRSR